MPGRIIQDVSQKNMNGIEASHAKDTIPGRAEARPSGGTRRGESKTHRTQWLIALGTSSPAS
jgi:hypothetical protein